MKIELRLPPCRRADEIATAACRAEHLGFDTVWFPDSQLLWRDVYATLAVVATRTGSIRLGTAVTNVETRHTSVLASAIRTVEELAPGRFVLGVGTGDSSLATIGQRPTCRRDLGAALEAVRRLSVGGEVDLGAGAVGMRDPAGPPPVYMAANGPKNLAFAGSVADGVILLTGTSRAALDRSVGLVREGARRADRDPDEIDIVVSAFCQVTDDVERDARSLKPVCAAIAQTGGAAFLALAGIDVDVPPSVPGVYPDLVHADDWDRAVEVCGRWVSDGDAVAFAEAFCLFGSVERILEQARAVGDAGATALLLRHVGSYDLPEDLMERVGRDVIPALGG